MESEEITRGKVHHGRNIRRTRLEKDIKQDVLSEMVHMTQPNVSKYENTRVIDDEILHRFARALKVPFEYLKNLEEEAPSVIFENNTINNSDHSTSNSTFAGQQDQQNTFNPIDRIMELYEKLLKEKDEKFSMLEKRLENLENGSNK